MAMISTQVSKLDLDNFDEQTKITICVSFCKYDWLAEKSVYTFILDELNAKTLTVEYRNTSS